MAPDRQQANSAGYQRARPAGALTPPPRTGWLTRSVLIGLAASVVAHIAIILLVGLVRVPFSFADAGGTVGEEGPEFTITTESELESISTSLSEAEQQDDLSSGALAADLLASLEELDPSLDPATLELPAAAGSGSLGDSFGSGAEAGAGSPGGASFFGLEASGQRFAYIVDKSSSMRTTDPLRAESRMALTQRELARSVDALVETAEFFVAFYADGAELLNNWRRWRPAIERNKLDARRSIFLVEPQGGTYPAEAFRLVLSMRPPPDAIYFMSDGRIENDVPAEIGRLNDRLRVPVHCIMFGDFVVDDERLAVERLMRRIASESGGSFTRAGGRP